MFYKSLTYFVAAVAIAIGLIVSPIPRQLGLYRLLAARVPFLVGFAPAFCDADKSTWKFTYEKLDADVDLTGQTALVTGANSGVGFETAAALARRGASVTLACRNPERCAAAAAAIRSKHPPEAGGGAAAAAYKVSTLILDTSSLASVREAAQIFLATLGDSPLDMLFLNAGTGSLGGNKDGMALLSEDGIESVFATNHVGHHLLYRWLEPALLKSKIARVVLTSSNASFMTFPHGVATDINTLNNVSAHRQSTEIYGQSKLAQILFAKQLTRRLGPDSPVYVNAADPGAVDTPLWEKNPLIPLWVQKFIISYFRENTMWNASEAALTMLYLGVAKNELRNLNIRGKFFHPQSQEVINPLSLDEDLQERVWTFCDDLVKDFAPPH